MSIEASIENLKNRVNNAYDACAEKGASIPVEKTTYNLPDCIRSISGGGELGGYDLSVTMDRSSYYGYYSNEYVEIERFDGVKIIYNTWNYSSNNSDIFFVVNNVSKITYIKHLIGGPTFPIGIVKINGVEIFEHNSVELTGNSTLYMYSDTGCFLKGTKITLADRTEKNIEDITYDDNLLVWDFDEGKWSSAKPIWIKKKQTGGHYHVCKFSNGTELSVTGTYPDAHRIFDVEGKKFTYSTEMTGKETMSVNGKIKMGSCELHNEECEFYNIITNYHMNVIANGIITSSSRNNLYPIEDMKFVKDNERKVRPMSDFEFPTEESKKFYLGCRLFETADSSDYVNKFIRQKWSFDVENLKNG